MNKVKKNAIYVAITNPNIYLKSLLGSTFMVGLSAVVIMLVYHFSSMEGMRIPPAMHSVIGIVIGLLLVFRTNTAYDRWWEGRKIIGDMHSDVCVLSAKMSNDKFFLAHCSYMLNDLRDYLKGTRKDFDSEQLSMLLNCTSKLEDPRSAETALTNLVKCANALKRIKNTPIPLSYALHIKISIYVYVLTLPFGLFYDMGAWAVVMVMVVYYVIAGVEIISNEIENPFADDPNDLPIDRLFDKMINKLSKKI